MRKARFVIVQVIIILIFFFFEIGSIFSDKVNKRELYINKPVTTSLNMKISNELSATESFHGFKSSVTSFMEKWDIKGASVAVTSHGRLVYAKGFGYADVEAGREVEPGNLFRMASVSKLITAIAIMQLSDQDRLDLDDQVFGQDGILNQEKYLSFTDSRVEQITIRHLLTHHAGWSRRSGDVMFMPHVVAKKLNTDLPVSNEEIIQYALTRRLNYQPGKRYSYSNLGYAILGEVIEQVTGIEYEDYCKLAIFIPLGISDMHLGGSFPEERAFNEVRYYVPSGTSSVLAYNSHDNWVPRQYGGTDIETLGAAGGWIASPAELLRLVTAIDGFATKPDILSDESIELMTRNGKRGRNMLGWKGSDGSGTWWRTGTLSGSSALLVRQRNGVNWFIAFNTTTSRNSRIHREASRMMFQAINSIDHWPEHDLFYYEKPDQVASKYLKEINVN